MEFQLNTSFLTGIACGLCLSALFINRRLLWHRSAIRIRDDGGEYKLILVVRNDLHMGKGKLAAQCAHAAVGAYSKALKADPASLEKWEYSGQAKIAVKVESEDELMRVHDAARAAGLITSMIRDAGRTQIEPNTRTVLGVGPAPKSVVDRVTGHLKLV